METEDLPFELKIHVTLDNYRFPLKTTSDKEETYRKAEKLINEYIREYLETYPTLQLKEVYLLVGFRLAVAIHKFKDENENPILDKIGEWSNLIKDALKD